MSRGPEPLTVKADDPILIAQLRDHEGERLIVYDDATGDPITPGTTVKGYASIGVGRNLLGKGLTEAESRHLLANDLAECIADLESFIWWANLSPIRQRALVDLRFNLGPAKFRRFKQTLAAVEHRDYVAAAAGMRASLWAQQTGRRARRLAVMMETDRDPGHSV